MLKLFTCFIIWLVSFLVLLPSDKPRWMGVLAAIATFQVLATLVNDLYDILLKVLEVLSLDALRKLEQDERFKNEDE